MKLSAIWLGAAFFLLSGAGHAAASAPTRVPFSGVDISGVYGCVGNDAHDGNFTSSMTLTLDRQYSSGQSGSFKVTVEGEHDSYTGSIVTNGKRLAMDFANKDLSKNDFGVALGSVSSPATARFKIEKFYYQPRYMGGSNGFETCTLK